MCRYLNIKYLIIVLSLAIGVSSIAWNDFTFDSNNSLTISGPNVGIGSSHPSATLDILGTIKISTLAGQTAGTILCLKAGGIVGYCSGVIAGLLCTCN